MASATTPMTSGTVTHSTTRHRQLPDLAGPAAGIAYVVLTMVGNGIAGETDRAADPALFQVGTALEFLGFAAFVCFAAFLFSHLRAADDSWLPTAMLAAAVANVSIKLATAAPWLVSTSLRPGELDPAIASVLDDIGQVGFALTFFTFGLMVVMASASWLRSGVQPRWLGRLGLGLGLAGMAAVVLPFDSEIAALPFLLSTLWLIAFCVSILRTGRVG